MKVVTKRGNSGYKYHKRGEDGTAVCCKGDDESAEWKEWDKETADVWRDPCMRERCFGEGQENYNSVKMHE